MRIAEVAPLAECIPPRRYGGTERVVSYLTEELVRLGHDVTLFASGDSETRARLISVRARAQRMREHAEFGMPFEVLTLEKVRQHAEEFDVLHFHIDYIHFPLVRCQGATSLTTPHGRLDIPAIVPLYREFSDLPLVSISDAQRRPLPELNWQATIYHGLPTHMYVPEAVHGEYLVFLGRLSPEKRVDHAVEIAARSDIPLKVAAKVDPCDAAYYEAVAKPAMRHPLVEYVGEIGDHEKQELLGGALALLFTIDWPEPFGLVMIESLACGTPVIGYRRGSVAEVVQHGVTGFVVDGVEQAVRAVNRVGEISRRRCRSIFEARFSVQRMAEDYLTVYRSLTESRRPLVEAASR